MGKSESKYFNTAKRMDEALLELLEHKDFEYITIKEICSKAEVNRSTFYLHYETIMDLLSESIRYMSSQMMDYFASDQGKFIERLHEADSQELYLITPEYLTPYLQYIKEHRKIFTTAFKQNATLGTDKSLEVLFETIINPIMNRFCIEEKKKRYILSFYVEGIMAIIKVWIQHDCEDSISFIQETIIECVQKPNNNTAGSSM